MSPKVTIACNGFCLLRHTKTWLARDIISYSGENKNFGESKACCIFIIVALKFINYEILYIASMERSR